MKQYAIVNVTKKEPVACLTTTGFSVKDNIQIINSWVKHMTKGEMSAEINVLNPVTGCYQLHLSDSPNWSWNYNGEVLTIYQVRQITCIKDVNEL